MAKWSSRLSEKDELDHKMMVEWSKESLSRTRFAYPANFLDAGPEIKTVDYLPLDKVIRLAEEIQIWPRKGSIGEYIGDIGEFRLGIRRDREYDDPEGKCYYTLGCAAIRDCSLLLLARYYTIFDNKECSLEKIYSCAEKSFKESFLRLEHDESKIKKAVERVRGLLK